MKTSGALVIAPGETCGLSVMSLASSSVVPLLSVTEDFSASTETWSSGMGCR